VKMLPHDEIVVSTSIDTSCAGAMKVSLNMTLLHSNGTLEVFPQRSPFTQASFISSDLIACTFPVKFCTDTITTHDDRPIHAS
jgi:hypothetical protein